MFICQRTTIQGSLVVLVLCSLLILKMQQKHNIIWMASILVGVRSLLFLLKKIGKSLMK